MYLTHRIAIYIPATGQGNEPAPKLQAEFTDKALLVFSEAFGGATVVDAVGAWVSPEHGLVKEPVKLVYAFSTQEAFDKGQTKVLAFAYELQRRMHQEVVAVEIDGTLQLVTTPPKVKVA